MKVIRKLSVLLAFCTMLIVVGALSVSANTTYDELRSCSAEVCIGGSSKKPLYNSSSLKNVSANVKANNYIKAKIVSVGTNGSKVKYVKISYNNKYYYVPMTYIVPDPNFKVYDYQVTSNTLTYYTLYGKTAGWINFDPKYAEDKTCNRRVFEVLGLNNNCVIMWATCYGKIIYVKNSDVFTKPFDGKKYVGLNSLYGENVYSKQYRFITTDKNKKTLEAKTVDRKDVNNDKSAFQFKLEYDSRTGFYWLKHVKTNKYVQVNKNETGFELNSKKTSDAKQQFQLFLDGKILYIKSKYGFNRYLYCGYGNTKTMGIIKREKTSVNNPLRIQPFTF